MNAGFLAFALIMATGAGAGPAPTGIQRAGWLQGCWELSADGRVVEEQWMAPRGGSMLGTSRTLRGGKLVEYELVVLQEKGDGLVYEAHLSGQPSAEFSATSVSDRMIVFENSGHDFPQRIGYQINGLDSLLAWIEGTEKGRARRIEFPYRRVPCPGR